MSNVWTEREIQWTIHWFKSWTAPQREEFLKELVEKSQPTCQQALDIAMRGLSMDEHQDIFQCQLRLFSQWFDAWTDKEKNSLVEKLKSLDPNFVDRLTFCINGCAK